MIKRTMLAACLAALAFAALPAIAAAEETTSNPGGPFLEGATEGTGFEITGPKGELNTVGGKFVKCESASGGGEFKDPETGTIELTFHGCKTTLNIPCTTPGAEPSGTIQVGPLPFHLKTVDHEGQHKPGVLITPAEKNEKGVGPFTEFKCSFAGTVKVKGNGIIGTITDPEEGVAQSTATVKFQEILNEEGEPTGVQTHQKVTNDETSYHLESSFNGAEYEEAAEEASGEMNFGEMTPTLQTTPTE